MKNHRFLWDLHLSVQEIGKVLRCGGRAIFIIGRRSVGEWQLKLDRFLISVFAQCHFRLEGLYKRRIEGKTTPPVINKLGHRGPKGETHSRVPTIREEYILTFRRL